MVMRKAPLLIVMCVSLTLLVACGGKGDEPEFPHDEPARRTVLVYMVADNSLGTNGRDLEDIDEMAEAVKANGLNGCNVVVYHHARGQAPELKRFDADGTLSSVKVYPYDNTTFSTDSSRMEQVIADTRRLAPSRELGMVLWSHGDGWVNQRGRGPQRSFGDDRSRSMKVTTLAGVLGDENLCFLYFDCCHMATIEVVYELRRAAPVIVGSVSELPAEGMPYQRNIPVFTADVPDMAQAARNTFEYYDELPGSHRTCTICVVNTAALDKLATATRRIMALSPATPSRGDVQRFMVSSSTCTLYDLAHFIDLTDCPVEIKDSWHAALDEAVMYRAATPWVWDMLAIDHHCGLGTYVLESPQEAYYRGYDTLAWWRDVVSANANFSQDIQ